ncbi:MAG: SUMF1/EgtB/PvdO family nonheme iron enzyme [Deltaproteobacteria bacterium]|nr:SUMF1/EgtB/PvdO family nonheme iron enzyme [Deltaproteobacteria bacterium]
MSWRTPPSLCPKSSVGAYGWDSTALSQENADSGVFGSGSYRVVRGGSWINDAHVLRSAGRGSGGPGNRYGSAGFRLVRTKN